MAVTKTPLPTQTERRAPSNGAPVTVVPRWADDGLGPPPSGSDGRGRGLPPAEPGRSPLAWRLGVWLALAAVSMMFIGFTSAYLVRREAPDWTGTGPLPWLLWVNTLVLLASSGVLELGRRARGMQGLRQGLSSAVALGLLFVAGQLAVWRQLVAAGVYLASSPHSAFFYVLTGVHALHVLIAMVWLTYAAVRVSRAPAAAAGGAVEGRASTRGGSGAVPAAPAADLAGMVAAAATFWHFMAGLWIFLFALLFAL